ncbi:LPXTG cell wall anchor domain-containing protein [Enterococcus innesii]|uniref:LPXTG cell wall anchor domain-containing protein n=1 Tax=Enterococcus innesii TaxID=2839759 RepID=UPI002DB9D49A|nr:LPXTG cell wall anchor domain-containing protein [Enterococcus innesii]MEB5953168.1 LPXTG cell wall anchor domain-containing protein [Enterococcus innesii]
MLKKIIKYIIMTLVMAFFSTSSAFSDEIQRVETNGKIGFTGVYEPIGTPDPTPPESIVKPSITEETNTNGTLPQTNDNESSWFLWLGILIISFVFLLWKRENKQIQNYNNKKAGIIT